MTGDIVTRLRDWANRLYPMKYGACMEQAADEIERLRAERDRWEEFAKNDVVMCDPNDPCEMCKELAAQDD